MSNEEFRAYNAIVQSLLMIWLLEHSHRGFYGIMYGDSLRICEPSPSARISDMRRQKKGMICSNMGIDKLKTLLALLEVSPVQHAETSDRTSALSRSYSSSAAAASRREGEMTSRQQRIYDRWLGVKDVTSSELCILIQRALVANNRMQYFNIREFHFVAPIASVERRGEERRGRRNGKWIVYPNQGAHSQCVPPPSAGVPTSRCLRAALACRTDGAGG